MDEIDNVAVLEDLLINQSDNIDKLTGNISRLTTSLEKLPTKKEGFRWLIIVNVVVIIALALSCIILWYSSHENHKLIAKVNDCVDQEGQCYQEGQARTGKAITLIINGVQCKVEEAIARGYTTAGLPTYELSKECLQALGTK